jgi:hypothetical protein
MATVSEHWIATVDMKHLTCDKAGLVAAEIEASLCDIIDGSKALYR